MEVSKSPRGSFVLATEPANSRSRSATALDEAELVQAPRLAPVPEPIEPITFETVRKAIDARYMQNGAVQLVIAALVIVSCVTYVLGSYRAAQARSVKRAIDVLDHISSVAFIGDYALTVMATVYPLDYVFSPMGVCDVLTVLPYALERSLAGNRRLGSKGRFLKIFRAFKALRVLKMTAKEDFIASAGDPKEHHAKEIDQHTVSLVLAIVCIFFIMTGLIFAIADNDGDAFSGGTGRCSSAADDGADGDDGVTCGLLWHDALYFVVVTFSTVGYGDLLPETGAARMVVVLAILITLTVVPIEISSLTEAIASRPKNAGNFVGRKGAPHVVICCDKLDANALFHLLGELLHEDHLVAHQSRHGRLQIVLLSPVQPTYELESLMKRYRATTTVFFCCGTAHRPGDLKRVRAEAARAIFVLTPTGVAHPEEPTADEGKATADSIVLSALTTWLYLHRATPKYLRERGVTEIHPLYFADASFGGGHRRHALAAPAARGGGRDPDARERSVGASAHGLLRGIAGGSGEAKPSADDERLKAFWERMDLPSPRERLFVQTFARSTRDELLEVGMRHVVSTHEIKASLLALGVAQPGAIALVVALLAHDVPSNLRPLIAKRLEKMQPSASASADGDGAPAAPRWWMSEYASGLEFEIYCIDLSAPKAAGGAAETRRLWRCPFSRLALALWETKRCVLLGVSDETERVHINPGPRSFEDLEAAWANGAAAGSGGARRGVQYMHVLAMSKEQALHAIACLFVGDDDPPIAALHAAIAAAGDAHAARAAAAAPLAAPFQTESGDGAVAEDAESADETVAAGCFSKHPFSRGPSVSDAAPGAETAAAAIQMDLSDHKASLFAPHVRLRTVLLFCPTAETLHKTALVIVKLWRLWPHVNVVLVHSGGVMAEARAVREIAGLLEGEFSKENVELLGAAAASAAAASDASPAPRRRVTVALAAAVKATLVRHSERVDEHGGDEFDAVAKSPARLYALARELIAARRTAEYSAIARAAHLDERARLSLVILHGDPTSGSDLRRAHALAQRVAAAGDGAQSPDATDAAIALAVARDDGDDIVGCGDELQRDGGARIDGSVIFADSQFSEQGESGQSDDTGDRDPHVVDRPPILCAMGLSRELSRASQRHVDAGDAAGAAAIMETHAVVELAHVQNLYYLPQRLWPSDDEVDYGDVATMYHWPCVAAGRALPSSITDPFVAMCFHQPPVLQLWSALLGMSGDYDYVGTSWFQCAPAAGLLDTLAKLATGATWGHVVRLLAAHNCVALGVYRGSKASSAVLRNGMPYVYLNPPADTPVDRSDSVFYIRSA